MRFHWKCNEWSQVVPMQWLARGYDEDLDEVWDYIQHEKGLALQKLPMMDRCDRLDKMRKMAAMLMMTQ